METAIINVEIAKKTTSKLSRISRPLAASRASQTKGVSMMQDNKMLKTLDTLAQYGEVVRSKQPEPQKPAPPKQPEPKIWRVPPEYVESEQLQLF